MQIGLISGYAVSYIGFLHGVVPVRSFDTTLLTEKLFHSCRLYGTKGLGPDLSLWLFDGAREMSAIEFL